MKQFRIAAAMAALALGACNGIGDGNKLDSLSVVPVAIAATSHYDTVASTKIFRCVRDQVKAYGKFTDNELGDYTARGRWSSDHPEIVKVSNGDLVEDHVPGQPDTTVFAAGTLTPVSPGTATISFEYVGLHQQIDVTVEDLANDAITITPADSSMAPGSSQFLAARADLGDTTADITAAATFSFVTPNDAEATLATDGFVRAVAPGAPLDIKATFTACDAMPTAKVTVKAIDQLSLTKEFDDSKLVDGLSEKLTVTADFGDDTHQDLSLLATYCVAPDPQGFVAFLASPTLRNYVLAANPGTVGIVALFPPVTSFTAPEGQAAYSCTNPPPAGQFSQSNDLALTAVAAQLCSIDVTPKTASVVFGTPQQFTATGTFTTATIDATHPAAAACANTASLITQQMTRHVNWAVSDATVATIITTSLNFPFAGLSSGIKAEGGTVAVTATGASTGALATANQVTDANTATLTITPKP